MWQRTQIDSSLLGFQLSIEGNTVGCRLALPWSPRHPEWSVYVDVSHSGHDDNLLHGEPQHDDIPGSIGHNDVDSPLSNARDSSAAVASQGILQDD